MRWTPSEDYKLSRCVEFLTAEEIGRALNRTESAVRSRVVRIRLSSPRVWTKALDARLIERLADGHRRRDIAEDFGRTLRAIHQRIHVLGLATPLRRWEPSEVETLTSLYEAGVPIWSICETLQRDKRSIYNKANRLNIERGHCPHPWRDEDRPIQRKKRVVVANQPVRRKGRNQYKAWTEVDKRKLAGCWIVLSCEELARALNRTVNAVRKQSRLQGLGRRWEAWQDDLIRRGVSRSLIALQTGRSLGAIASRAFRLRRSVLSTVA